LGPGREASTKFRQAFFNPATTIEGLRHPVQPAMSPFSSQPPAQDSELEDAEAPKPEDATDVAGESASSRPPADDAQPPDAEAPKPGDATDVAGDSASSRPPADDAEHADAKVAKLEDATVVAGGPAGPTGLVHVSSTEHFCRSGKHIERPERVGAIMRRLEEEGLAARCSRVSSREVTLAELGKVHSEAYLHEMQRINELDTQVEVDEAASEYKSVYLTQSSMGCAREASGAVIEMVRLVLRGELSNGLAVVRPPGHHAEGDECCGFCVFNNVAVAASEARVSLGAERVLIVDWDVHHGNGTQHTFEEDPSVLYFSAHRYDDGEFFPGSKDAAPQVVGR